MPDMNRDWLKDLDAYNDNNFLMPMDDDPAGMGKNPKMARAKQARAELMKRAALKKAEACLKIAEYIFPDAIEDFVDSQASDFMMHLPDRVVLATLKRIAIYDAEPEQADALLGKVAEEKEAEPEMAAEPMMEEAAPEAAPSSEPEMEDAEASEDGDQDALLQELEQAVSTTKASINPSTEFGDMFAYDGDINDISDVVTASVDDELAGLFAEEYSSPNHLRKSASVNKSSTTKNFKLSEAFGNAVPRDNAVDLASALWDVSPNVADSFK
jgi:hypothetical protein